MFFVLRNVLICAKSYLGNELNGLIRFCIFVVKFYVKYWFTCTIAAHAPANDLEFLESLQKYRKVDREIADAAILKIAGHTWYLSDILVGLAFFDNRIDNQTKKKMVKALSNEGNGANDIQNGNITATSRVSIVTLISNRTVKLFQILSGEENHPFLTMNPSQWSSDAQYNKMNEIVKDLAVVNDSAERAIGLMKKFNNTLIKSQKGQNELLQSVENFRKEIPNSKKSTIIETLSKQ